MSSPVSQTGIRFSRFTRNNKSETYQVIAVNPLTLVSVGESLVMGIN